MWQQWASNICISPNFPREHYCQSKCLNSLTEICVSDSKEDLSLFDQRERGWISARKISVPTCNLLARRQLFLFALGFRKNWGYQHYKWRFQGWVNTHWPVGCWSSSNSSVKLSRNEHHLGAGPRDCNNANISMFYSHTQPCHFQLRSHGNHSIFFTLFTRNERTGVNFNFCQWRYFSKF